jgi:hypothetical protein
MVSMGYGATPELDVLLHNAYTAGFLAGRRDMLVRIGELDRAWRPAARRTEAERIRERVAEMEDYGRRRAQREGRPYRDYPGGPVDWDTGRPLAPAIPLPARTARVASQTEGVAA